MRAREPSSSSLEVLALDAPEVMLSTTRNTVRELITGEDTEDIRSTQTIEAVGHGDGNKVVEHNEDEDIDDDDLADDEEDQQMDEVEAKLEAALEFAMQELMGHLSSVD